MTNRRLLGNSRSTWLLIGSIVSGIIIFNVYLAFHTVRELNAIQSSMNNTGNIIAQLDDLHVSVLSAESGQRGYLITDDLSYLTPYQTALNQVHTQIENARKIQSELPAQQLRIQEIIKLTEAKLREMIETVELAKQNKDELALKLVNTDLGQQLYSRLRVLLDAANLDEKRHRSDLLARLAKSRTEATITFAVSGVTSSGLVIIMLVLAWANIRNENKNLELLEMQNQTLTRKVEERTRELELYAEELSRSNRELEDFAFVASHDLQEPLRKIQAFGDRLESSYSEVLEARGLDYLNRMRNAANRMSALITDLLEFSRVSTRGREFADTDLNEVISTVLDDLEIAIKESDATVNVVTLPVLQADNSQLQQLFLNLLSNALKFRKAERQPNISITVEPYTPNNAQAAVCDDWYQIRVTDNGIGFEQEYAEKIFTPFQRLHGRSEYKGTGIGLAVCRRIVERHRGTITATAQPDAGAVFTIILPAIATPFGS